MSNYSYLIIDFESFKETILNFISQGNELLRYKINSQEDLADCEAKTKQWEENIQSCLTNSFAIKTNSFYYEFMQTGTRRGFAISKNQQDFIQGEKALKESISSKIEYLSFNLRIISECDYIIGSDKADLSIRAKYSTQEKLSFILGKLYKLNDGSFYPLKMLMDGNGVRLNSNVELYELADILESKDYIVKLGGLGEDQSVRITASGSLYWEEKGTPYLEDYSDVSNSQTDIDNRIQEIITTLNNLGLGQEILFEELLELKELYGKLNKKNWSQIVKGKIVDLALAKLIENDTVKYIYEKLTGHDLRLP